MVRTWDHSPLELVAKILLLPARVAVTDHARVRLGVTMLTSWVNVRRPVKLPVVVERVVARAWSLAVSLPVLRDIGPRLEVLGPSGVNH